MNLAIQRNRLVAVTVGVAIALSFLFASAVPAHAAALTSGQIQSILDLLTQFGADQSVINNVDASLRGGTPSGPSTPAAAPANDPTPSLTIGSTGNAVIGLQTYLESTGHFTFTGPKGFFGPITRSAVAAWQADNNVAPAVGFWGPISYAKYQELIAAAPPAPGPGPSDPVAPAAPGTGLSVFAGTQPANDIAPASAVRVPFTNFTVTAGNDGAVTLDSVRVKRAGVASDSNFSGVVLLDSDGLILGIPRSLGSTHEATIGEAVTIPAGQSRTFTVAGNVAAAASVENGTIAKFEVIALNTSAAVTGNLPIVGASHTMNSTLSIGSLTTARGPFDPGANTTQEVGETDFDFSSVKFTVGSAEDAFFKSITWEQSGSASSDDFANIVTIVNGTEYPTILSANGQRYTSLFPGDGILVDKGNSVDVTLRGDIVSGSNRTADFDIQKNEDVYFVGADFGFGIAPPLAGSAASADSSNFNNSDDPYYDASQVTINPGTLTVSSWTGVGAQNIAINLNDQPLGGFSVDVRGEAVNVSSMVFNVLATGDEAENVTNATLVDQNGSVIAGPVDGTSNSSNSADGKFTFTDNVTFPVGVTNLTLRGKLGTNFATNDTVAASSTPSTDWTTVTGDVTGKTITPSPASAVSGNTMTVKAGALTVTRSSQPTARNVVAGATQFDFAHYTLDSTNSGEDVRLATLPLYYDTSGTRTDLTNCQLRDGVSATAPSLTTGSNLLNPTTSDTASSTTFTFDGSGLVIPKGTTKTLAVRCDVVTGTTNTYWWGIDAGQNASFTGATGVTSGQTVTETFTDSSGTIMTAVSGGSYTVTSDTSNLYKIAQAGDTGVVLAGFRFEANTSEALDIAGVALQLGNTASNSPADLVGEKVTLWHDGVKVGEAQFGSANADNATSTLTTPVRVERGEFETIEVRGDLNIHNADEGTPGAFFAVTYDGDNVGLNGNYATGVDSGSTISSGTTSDVTTNGLRIFRSIPTIADVTPAGRQLSAGTDLYELKITAGSGRDIGIKYLAFDISTTGATVTNFQLFGPSGAVNGTAVDSQDGVYLGINFDATNVDRRIPAGTSKTYRLRGNTVSGLTAANTETLNVNFRGDTAYPSLANLMGTVATIQASASTTDSFIWTPFSTTTPTETAAMDNNLDWTNGYGVAGFPGVGQDMAVQAFNH